MAKQRDRTDTHPNYEIDATHDSTEEHTHNSGMAGPTTKPFMTTDQQITVDAHHNEHCEGDPTDQGTTNDATTDAGATTGPSTAEEDAQHSDDGRDLDPIGKTINVNEAWLKKAIEDLDTSVREQILRLHSLETDRMALLRALQKENEQLRHQQLRHLLKPVYEKLVELASSAALRAEVVEEPDARNELTYHYEAIEDLLLALDYDLIKPIVGDMFNPVQHHAIASKKTDNHKQVGSIASVRRFGLIQAGEERPLMPARVTTYRPSTDNH